MEEADDMARTSVVLAVNELPLGGGGLLCKE